MLAAMCALPVAGALARGELDTLAVRTAKGELELKVELALTPQEQSRGLMFRKELAPLHGMLFNFPTEAPVTFWMQNTPLSLDMLFIDRHGTVKHVHARAEPLSEKTISPPMPVQAVLEIAGGEAERLGIKVGDRVVHRFFR